MQTMFFMIFLAAAAQIEIETPRTFHEGDNNSSLGRIRVTPVADEISVGEVAELRLLLTVDRGFFDVTNPFWYQETPGTVAVFSETGDFLGRVQITANKRPAGRLESLEVGPGNSAGILLAIPTAEKTIRSYSDEGPVVNALGSGTFYFQARCTNLLIDRSESDDILAVSEVAQLKVVKRNDPNSKKQSLFDWPTVEVEPNKQIVAINERFAIQVRLTNATGKSMRIGNAMSMHTAPKGLSVLLRNEQDVLLGDMLTVLEYSGPMSGRNLIPPNAIVGRRIELTAGRHPFPVPPQKLPSGDYYMQAEYTDCSFADDKTVDKSSSAKSKPIKLTIVE